MTKGEIEAELQRLGEWTYDIQLPHGIWTRGNVAPVNRRLKRVLQASIDLLGRPLAGCRVLDLGCLEGMFAIEFALHGCSALGVEARQCHIDKGRLAARALGVEVEFVCDDVRNISLDKYGAFDIILCSGILYHLDADGVFDLIDRMNEMTRRLVVIDTHVSLRPTVQVQRLGREYAGSMFREHTDDSSREEREANGWASIDNVESFWPTRPSLVNALMDAGFSSVHECLAPSANLDLADRCTFVAVKGAGVRLLSGKDGPRETIGEGKLRYA